MDLFEVWKFIGIPSAIAVFLWLIFALTRRNPAIANFRRYTSATLAEALASGRSDLAADVDGLKLRFNTLRLKNDVTPKNPNGDIAIVSLHVMLPSPGTFILRAEKAEDTHFKRTGISVELQTGDAGFDRHWYVDSATPEFVQAYFASAARREAVQALAALGALRLFLHVAEGQAARKFGPAAYPATLKAIFNNASGDFRKNPQRIIDAVPALRQLTSDLPVLAGSPREAEFRRSAIDVVQWPMLVKIMLPVIALPFLGYTLQTSRLVDFLDAVLLAGLLTLFILGAYAWFVLQRVRGSSSAHRVWIADVVMAAMAVPMYVYVGLEQSNWRLDSQPAIRRTVEVQKLHSGKTTGRRSKAILGDEVRYYARVKSWNEGDRWESLRISKRAYTLLTEAGTPPPTLIAVIHPGLLGLEWMEGHEVVGPDGATLYTNVPPPHVAEIVAPPVQMPPRRTHDPFRVANMIDKIEPLPDSMRMQVFGSGLIAEVHGQDLRVVVDNLAFRFFTDKGPQLNWDMAAGILLTRDDGWTACMLDEVGSIELDDRTMVYVWVNAEPTVPGGTSNSYYGFTWLNPEFEVPDGARCADGKCTLQLLVTIVRRGGRQYFDYSAAVPLPVSDTGLLKEFTTPMMPCGERLGERL